MELGTARRRNAPAAVSQVLSSLTNLIAALFALRSGAAASFGRATISILAFFIVGSLARSAYGSLAQARSRFPSESGQFEGLVVLSALRWSGLTALPAAAAAVAINGTSFLLHGFVLLVALPGTAALDAYRFSMVSAGKPTRAVIIDALWLVSTLVVGVLVYQDRIGPEAVVSLWLLTGGILGVGVAAQYRRLSSQLDEFRQRTWRISSNFGMSAVIASIPNFVFPFLAVLVVSKEELAGVRAVETAFGAVVLASSTAVLTYQHQIIEHSELGELQKRNRLILKALTLVFVAFALTVLGTTIGGRLIEWVLGSTFGATTVTERLLISAKYLAIVPASLLTYHLVSTRQEGLLVRTRLLMSVLATGTGLLACRLWNLPTGMAVVFAITSASNFAFVGVAVRRFSVKEVAGDRLLLNVFLALASLVIAFVVTTTDPLRLALLTYLVLSVFLVRSALKANAPTTAALLFGLALYTGVGVYAVEYVGIIRNGGPGIGSTPKQLLNHRGSSFGFLAYASACMIMVRWFSQTIGKTPFGRSLTLRTRQKPGLIPNPRSAIAAGSFVALSGLALGAVVRWSSLSYQNNDAIKSNPLLFFVFAGLPFLTLFWVDVASNEKGNRRVASLIGLLSALLLLVIVARIGARNQAVTLVTGLAAFAVLGPSSRTKGRTQLLTKRNLILAAVIVPLLLSAAALRVSRGTDVTFTESLRDGSAVAQFANVDNIVDQDYRYPPLILLREMGPQPVLDRASIFTVGAQSVIPFAGSNTLSRTFAEPIDPVRTENGEGFGYLVIADGWVLFGYLGAVFSAGFLSMLFAVVAPNLTSRDPRFARLMSAAAISLIVPIMRTSTGGALGLSIRYLLPLAVLHAGWRGCRLGRSPKHALMPDQHTPSGPLVDLADKTNPGDLLRSSK